MEALSPEAVRLCIRVGGKTTVGKGYRLLLLGASGGLSLQSYVFKVKIKCSHKGGKEMEMDTIA